MKAKASFNLQKNLLLLQAGVDPAQLGQKRATVFHKNKKKVEKRKWRYDPSSH